MKKHLWMAAAVCLLSLASCATSRVSYESNKTPIAVLDFMAGAGVEQTEVDGLSDMLINTLHETGKFVIVERTQLNKVIKEQEIQQSDLTNEQIAEVGRILNVEDVIIGTVNLIAAEYNVDVRVVDCTTGAVVTTAGAVKRKMETFRKLMREIGKEIGEEHKVIGAAEREGAFIYHKVRFGESMYSIARKYQVNPADIMRWNNMSTRHLLVEQQLKIYTKMMTR